MPQWGKMPSDPSRPWHPINHNQEIIAKAVPVEYEMLSAIGAQVGDTETFNILVNIIYRKREDDPENPDSWRAIRMSIPDAIALGQAIEGMVRALRDGEAYENLMTAHEYGAPLPHPMPEEQMIGTEVHRRD